MNHGSGQNESEIARLSRLYAALSEINQTLLRVSSREDLFERTCRLLVERGGFHVAWLGWADPETSLLKPVAHFSDRSADLWPVIVDVNGGSQGQGPTSAAFRSGEPVVIEDLANAMYSHDTSRGVETVSAAAFPIRERGKVGGALTVYLTGPLTFRKQELALLEEAASGLSFALDRLLLDDERARALERLARERDFSDAVINSLPGVLYLYDLSGKFLRWNRSFETVTEYGPDEIARMHPLDFFAGADADLVRSRIADVFIHGEASVEAGFVSKSGKVTAYFFTGLATQVEGKQCLVGIGIDISGRKQAEADLVIRTEQQAATQRELAEREALLRIAGRAARVGGWTVTLPERGVRWSEEVRELLDAAGDHQPTLEEAFALYVPQSRAALQAKFEACASEGRPFNLEVELDTFAGRRLSVRIVAEAHRNEDGRIVRVQGALQDITEQVRLAQQYRQAQKMEAIGQLAGGVAHDFNNLLSVILSYSAIVCEQMRPGDPSRNDVEEIQRAGERAADLTKQLLAFSRQQVLQPRAFVLSETVAAMERLLRRLLGEHIELSFISRRASGKVYADPSQVEQVVMNLAVNARDAMPQGGKLSIEIGDADLGSAYAAEYHGVDAGDYVMLTVSDTGTGMDEKTKERIFEPFFTTKDKAKGTGLGLATVFGIVKQSKGHVFVDSELGRGTTFRIYFPRTERDPADIVRSIRAPQVLQGTETVLLVEDEDQLRVVTRAILERNGYHVLDACDGDQAIAVCVGCPSEIVLLVTDVVMPRMSGKQLADRLLLLRPELKVLFMSGYTEDSIVHHGVLDDGIEFLPKPITPAALLRKVREVLDDPARGRHASRA